MSKYDTDINSENPLNMSRTDKRYCPVCGADTWGSRVADNHYKLKLVLWNGSPNTKVPERKDLEMDLCFKCRNKIYNSIKDTVDNIRNNNQKG